MYGLVCYLGSGLSGGLGLGGHGSLQLNGQANVLAEKGSTRTNHPKAKPISQAKTSLLASGHALNILQRDYE